MYCFELLESKQNVRVQNEFVNNFTVNFLNFGGFSIRPLKTTCKIVKTCRMEIPTEYNSLPERTVMTRSSGFTRSQCSQTKCKRKTHVNVKPMCSAFHLESKILSIFKLTKKKKK